MDETTTTDAREHRCKRCTGRYMAVPLYIGNDLVPNDYCPKCRVARLAEANESTYNAAALRRELGEIEAFKRLLEAEEHKTDYRVIDENGVEVWARQLAKRYRKQTKPRGVLR